MSPQLKTIINESRELTPVEQMELIAAISKLLQNTYQSLAITDDFWRPKTLDQHYNEHAAPVVENIGDFAVDFWPEAESIDEFNAYVAKQRHKSQMGNE